MTQRIIKLTVRVDLLKRVFFFLVAGITLAAGVLLAYHLIFYHGPDPAAANLRLFDSNNPWVSAGGGLAYSETNGTDVVPITITGPTSIGTLTVLIVYALVTEAFATNPATHDVGSRINSIFCLRWFTLGYRVFLALSCVGLVLYVFFKGGMYSLVTSGFSTILFYIGRAWIRSYKSCADKSEVRKAGKHRAPGA
jgi:hypothetical protein